MTGHRVRTPTLLPLWREARRVSSAASRLPGSTSLRFAPWLAAADAYGGLGNVYSTRGDLKQAETMFKKSLELNKALGSKTGMAVAYANLGIVYSTRGDLKQAEAMYHRALGLYQDIGAVRNVKQVEGLLAKLQQPN